MKRMAQKLSCNLAIGWGVVFLTGCGGGEVANVSFSYQVKPSKGLPPGMNTIAIMPAQVTESTDPKWSDLSTTILASLVNDSRTKYNTPITVTERRDTKPVFDEADLAAAGMSTRKGGQPGQLLDADGYLLAKINVKTEVHKGKERTLSGLDLSALSGRHVDGGRINAETSEVETVTRNMTVQTEFKLLDTRNGKVWEQFAPPTFTRTEKTNSSPIFGSSKTEAALTPQDRIIYGLVERGAREFIAQLMACRVDVQAEVRAGSNPNSVQGVKLLRAEAWDDALAAFKTALSEKPNDARSAFGAGVASEGAGRSDEALKYYNQAYANEARDEYRDARDRVKAYSGRVVR